MDGNQIQIRRGNETCTMGQAAQIPDGRTRLPKQCKQLIKQKRGGDDGWVGIMAKAATLKYTRAATNIF